MNINGDNFECAWLITFLWTLHLFFPLATLMSHTPQKYSKEREFLARDKRKPVLFNFKFIKSFSSIKLSVESKFVIWESTSSVRNFWSVNKLTQSRLKGFSIIIWLKRNNNTIQRLYIMHEIVYTLNLNLWISWCWYNKLLPFIISHGTLN